MILQVLDQNKQILGRLDHFDERFNNVEERLDKFEEKVEEKLNKIESRLEFIEQEQADQSRLLVHEPLPLIEAGVSDLNYINVSVTVRHEQSHFQ